MKLSVQSQGPDEPVFIIDLDSLKFIARMDDDLSRDEQVHAAEFIIRASNSYDDLLRACKSALNWTGNNTAATRQDGDARLAEIMQNAISKAEE